MEITKISENIAKIKKNGEQYLGIETRIPSNSFALTKLSNKGKPKVWIVRGQSLEEWKPTVFTEFEKRILLYGPYHEGRTLSELLDLPPKDLLPCISRLASALKVLAENQIGIQTIHTGCIVFLNDGGILFLPAEIMDSIKSHQVFEDQVEYFEYYNYPDLRGEKNHSYSIAIFLYKCFTGKFPFSGDSEEEIHNQQRNMDFLAPKLFKADLKSEISETIYSVIKDPAENFIDLHTWSKKMDDWLRDGLTETLTKQEIEAIQLKAEKQQEKFHKAYKRKSFVQKNWKLALIITVVAVLAGTIPYTIISNALKPRVTAGFPPEKVVETFYYGINSFDHSTMEDCVIEKAGQPEINEAVNFFVMTRQRMSVEGQTGFIDVREWQERGRPEIPEFSTIYGVTDLDITVEKDDPGQKIMLAEFTKWQPRYPENVETNLNESSKATTEIRRKIHRLYLQQDGEDWVIYKIDRLEDERIGVYPD